MTKSNNMKKHLNILFLSLLGGSMFGQQLSSKALESWLDQATKPIKIESPIVQKALSQSFQNKLNLTYCTPAEISSPEEITRVSIKTSINTLLDHVSANNTAIGYEDFTTVKPAELGLTSKYTLSFQGDTKGAYYSSFTIMIDYNNDGIFGRISNDDQINSREIINVDELLFNSNGVDGKSVSQTITIPQDATLGETRMRILKRQTDYKSALHPKTACDLGSVYGQVEDYTISLVPPKVCTNTPNGAAYQGTFIPTNNVQDTFLKNVSLGSYVDIFVYEGNDYTFEPSVKNAYLSLKDLKTNTNLTSIEGAFNWKSTLTGTVRLYLHGNENCDASTDKTDVTIFVMNMNKNPINEPCNLGIPSVDFNLTKELNGTKNQEIAFDINAYGGRSSKITGLKINLQGDASKVDFELLEDTNGLPSTLVSKIVGKIISKTSLGTINGKPSYQYDIDFDKPIDLNALETTTSIKKWLKLVTDAQTLEVNSNFAVATKLASKNSTDNQGKWTISTNLEAVYQLKAECLNNACNQVIPETPKIADMSLPTIEGMATSETAIDIVAEKGKKLTVSGIEIDGWFMGLSMDGTIPKDELPTMKLNLLSANLDADQPINKDEDKNVLPIGIEKLDTVNLQTVYIPSDQLSILLIKKKISITFDKPVTIDGDIASKYWLSFSEVQNLGFWDVNPNVDVTIGSFPKAFVMKAIPPGIPNDMWSSYNSEIVYKLISTCSSLATNDQEKLTKTRISPNPFTNQVTIESVNLIKSVEVFNMAGLKVNSQDVNLKKTNLNLGHLNTGVYLIRILDEKGNVETQKLIKK